MKKIELLKLIVLVGIVSLQSCEDPIDVELEIAESLITVDAWINANAEDQTIRLTQSQAYFDNTFTEGISGANVIVRRDDGQEFLFEELEVGTYVWTSDGKGLGVVGNNFELEINVGNERLIASTKLHRVPDVDSIYQEYVTDVGFIDGIMIEILTRDFPGIGDTYWLKTFKNGTYLNKAEEINIAYDAGFDSGAESDGVVFIPPVRALLNPIEDDSPTDEVDIPSYLPGDHVRVEIHSISNEAFAFMETMRDQLLNSNNGILAEAPANTGGNVSSSSGATVLGIFNVAAISYEERFID